MRWSALSRLSYAAKLVLAAVEGRHVESAVDLLVPKGGFVNPLSHTLYRQETSAGEILSAVGAIFFAVPPARKDCVVASS